MDKHMFSIPLIKTTTYYNSEFDVTINKYVWTVPVAKQWISKWKELCMSSKLEVVGLIEDPFTPCSKLLDRRLIIYVPKLHNIPWLPYQKNASRPQFKPIIRGNEVKFSTFFTAWSNILCYGPNLFEVMSKIVRQLKQEGSLRPKKIKQPYWIISPSEGVLHWASQCRPCQAHRRVLKLETLTSARTILL